MKEFLANIHFVVESEGGRKKNIPKSKSSLIQNKIETNSYETITLMQSIK